MEENNKVSKVYMHSSSISRFCMWPSWNINTRQWCCHSKSCIHQSWNLHEEQFNTLNMPSLNLKQDDIARWNFFTNSYYKWLSADTCI